MINSRFNLGVWCSVREIVRFFLCPVDLADLAGLFSYKQEKLKAQI